MLAGLLDASHLMPLDALPDTAVEYARAAGFTGLLWRTSTARGCV